MNMGKATVLVGVTFASAEEIDMTDAAKNKKRYVCSFFNGKLFGPDKTSALLEGPIEEMAVRLDMDEGKLYFAANGAEFGAPAVENLPAGLSWLPYFSLGAECSITVI